MRNSILVTALIAFLAGVLVLTIAQSDQVRTWFGADVQTEEPIDETADVSAIESDAAVETAEVTENETATEAVAETATVTEAASDEVTAVEQEILAQQQAALKAANTDPAAENTATEPAAGQSEASEEMLAKLSGTETEETAKASNGEFKVDVQAALKDRVIGNPNAPILVEEFSSLTCPHCAFFHKSIFPKIKEKYIDTGKVRWVIRGFPLNEPALRAEMVARCAPNDQYMKLIDFMYENQPKWAFTDNPMGTLSIMLRVAGVTNNVFEACANNTELETAMIGKIEKAATDHQINSTPTFVLDGQKTISGAGTFVGFSYDLDAILRGKGLYEEPKADYNADAAVPPAANSAQSTFTNK